MRTILLLFLLSAVTVFGKDSKQLPKVEVKNSFIESYNDLHLSLKDLNEINSSKSEVDQEIINAFFEARIAFKKIEFLLSYLDNEFINDHVNGAPLLKTERKAPGLVIISPSGFQIAEEKLFEGDFTGFSELTNKLEAKLSIFGPKLQYVKLGDRMIFEAFREGVIRIISLGITGFDTPSAENTVSEAITSLNTLEAYLHFYDDYLSEEHKIYFKNKFEEGRGYLVGVSFDDVNRYQLIKNVLNPLYGDFLEIQDSLFIEQRDIVFSGEFPVNYKATSLFKTDFLNPGYFSRYNNSGDAEKRKELGKLLFFDPILSKNNERACASCHDPSRAFTDAQTTSLAFNGEGNIDRNSPTVINAVFNTKLFWDGRATTLEEQVEHVVHNDREFNTDFFEIIDKMSTSQEYKKLFDEAYPRIKKINSYTIIASLSAYVKSLVSFDSEFDKSMHNESSLTASELKRMENGFNIFAGKAACATCHFVPTFGGNVPPRYNDTETEVLGIPEVNDQANAMLDGDEGRYDNGRPKDRANFYKHSFKTPTVRNIEVTGPYMHNGVFTTLEEVVDYYDVGGGHGWGIAPENTTLPEDSLNLTKTEKEDLIFYEAVKRF